MLTKENLNDIKNDISASIVVFLVALPLCLGIALASGAPLFSGIIAGIVGGIVVGIASGSALGVSGPAAGLTVIVFSALQTVDSWNAFLLAVFIAGFIQLTMGYAKAGFIAFFFPSSVIKGMLTGIGLLIILKQLPHAIGYDHAAMGDLAFHEHNGDNTITAITHALCTITPAAAIISSISILLLILWDLILIKKHKIFQLIQGPLAVVFVGIFLNYIFSLQTFNIALEAEHLVRLPVSNNFTEFFNQFEFPDFNYIFNYDIWEIAIILAIVASIETLLCVEATDKLDPQKRITPTNRELKAQGLGNIISGLLGGLPITQVIVRSSANINFGAKSKLSTIIHGILLLLSAIFIAEYLNMLPLATLATILITVGYKLAKPALFKQMYLLGNEQFIPFIGTVIGILITDLLKGIIIGILLGLFYTLKHSYRNAYYMKEVMRQEDGQVVRHIVLAEEVSFFHKASIIEFLSTIPESSSLIIDCTNSKSISYDVVEIINNFKSTAENKNINFRLINFIKPLSNL